MTFRKIIKREIEVAFSKDAQPLWFRILKYAVLGILLYCFWDSKTFWILFLIGVVLSFLLHLWYRHKTDGWTKSYGLWKHENERRKKD